jgi:hypothetical protein
MQSLIQSLIQNDEMVLFRDYRSGTLRDWSGNGNHGTGSNMHLRRGLGGTQAHFNDANGYEQVPDDPILRTLQGTLVAFGEFNKLERATGSTSGRIISKRDGGGANYDWILTADPRMDLYCGVETRTLNVDYRGARSLAVDFSNGEKPKGWKDGLLLGEFSDVLTVTSDDAPVYFGNWYAATRSLLNPLTAALIINRRLSDDEHAQLVSEVIG